MGRTLHRVYLAMMVVVVISVVVYLIAAGYSYYQLNIEDRFFNDHHQTLKPSGSIGHGLGIAGSLMMLFGVSLYMIRKRVRRFSRLGVLKYWLEFHIFLCTLGPILVLFHTAFKFGGIVAVSFWSMVAVVASGIAGRYIYLQIPRTIEGRELSLNELEQKKEEMNEQFLKKYKLEPDVLLFVMDAVKERPVRSGRNLFARSMANARFGKEVKQKISMQLKSQNLDKTVFRELMQLVRSELSLNRKIDRLTSMQNLFRYWHVAHLPFALIMLVIMIVHVGVTLAFGYKWIF